MVPKPSNILRKRFIAAESDTLVIETIQTESKTSRQSLRLLKLKGTWRANDYNELCFEVTCRKGPPETYTFKGSWKLNNVLYSKVLTLPLYMTGQMRRLAQEASCRCN